MACGILGLRTFENRIPIAFAEACCPWRGPREGRVPLLTGKQLIFQGAITACRPSIT